MDKYHDMPKLLSPFKREDIKGKYICTNKIEECCNWIFDSEKVIATEKFDGTNLSVIIKDGKIIRVLNCTNLIDIWNSSMWFYNGIKRAIDEKKFKPEMLPDGQYFGELIGEKIQGNPYKVEGHLWLPFNYIKEHFAFKFYNHWLEETKGQDNLERKGLKNLLKESYFIIKIQMKCVNLE